MQLQLHLFILQLFIIMLIINYSYCFYHHIKVKSLLFNHFKTSKFISSSYKSSRLFLHTNTQDLIYDKDPIRICTYNVLSSHLSQPDWFSSCAPEHLNPTNRLQKLQLKLEEEMEIKSIICLQEVSQLWSGKLHVFFAKNNYYFIHCLYGNKMNNYMGVGIAIPIDQYIIKDSNTVRIGDMRSLPREKKSQSNSLSLLQKLKKVWGIFFPSPYSPSKKDIWQESLDRKNQLVAVTVKDKRNSRSFIVATYHMPCIFQIPAIMSIHCSLSAKYIQDLSKRQDNIPFIFCGDFNIKPDSQQYKLLTNGTLDTNTTADYPPKAFEEDDWKVDITPMTSVYKQKLGQEPEFTNFAKVKDEPVFIETLDYIFCSKDQWKVNQVLKLPLKTEALLNGKPFPSISEPSDHIMLAADLSLSN